MVQVYRSNNAILLPPFSCLDKVANALTWSDLQWWGRGHLLQWKSCVYKPESAWLPRAMPGSRHRLVQSEWGKANHHDVLIAACSATNACSPGLHAWDCMH